MQLLKGYEGKKATLKINGHKVPVTVSIRYEFEQELPKAGDDFDFGDAEANAEYERRFQTGELVNVYIQVSVNGEGLEGMDSLGACHVKASTFEADVLETVKWHDMRQIASDDLTKQILDAAQRFPKYLTKAG